MARVATKLTPTANGGWSARKRIPADCQADYGRLYGQRWEERFNSGSMPILLARQKHREWSSEIEARIQNIRAEANGHGQTLTPKQARALAGDWYGWFTTRHLAKGLSAIHWDEDRSDRWSDFRAAVWSASSRADRDGRGYDPQVDTYDVLEGSDKARERVRPMIGDWAESSQFLHAKRLTLDGAARDMFLDHLCHDFFEALTLLLRRARGDYGHDQYADQFPKIAEAADISVRTVATMRATWRELQENWPSGPEDGLDPENWPAQPHELTWVRTLLWRQQDPVKANDGWREERAAKIVETLRDKNIAFSLTKDPEVTALALHMLDSRLPDALVMEWARDMSDLLLEMAVDEEWWTETELQSLLRRIKAETKEEILF